MSQVPTFQFLLRDAADLGPMPRAFVNALIATRRFYRNNRSQLLFLADVHSSNNDSFVIVSRWQELQAILAEHDVLRITGDSNEEAIRSLWLWVCNRRFMVPAVSSARLPLIPLPPRTAQSARVVSR